MQIYSKLLPTAWRVVAFTGTDDSVSLPGTVVGRDELDTVSKSFEIPVNQ